MIQRNFSENELLSWNQLSFQTPCLQFCTTHQSRHSFISDRKKNLLKTKLINRSDTTLHGHKLYQQTRSTAQTVIWTEAYVTLSSLFIYNELLNTKIKLELKFWYMIPHHLICHTTWPIAKFGIWNSQREAGWCIIPICLVWALRANNSTRKGFCTFLNQYFTEIYNYRASKPDKIISLHEC